MSWDPKNGYSLESYKEYPDREEASATLSGVTSLAPNRGSLISSSAVPYPSNASQQGTATLSSAPTIAGISAAAIQWYKSS